jgi:hypothetical protein
MLRVGTPVANGGGITSTARGKQMGTQVGNRTRPRAPLAGVPPSSAERTPPALADEVDGPFGATLWFKEPGEPPLWHIATERIAYGWYRTECEWEVRVRYADAIWPAKRGDPGPVAGRCRSCVEMHAVSCRLARRFGGRGAR